MGFEHRLDPDAVASATKTTLKPSLIQVGEATCPHGIVSVMDSSSVLAGAGQAMDGAHGSRGRGRICWGRKMSEEKHPELTTGFIMLQENREREKGERKGRWSPRMN